MNSPLDIPLSRTKITVPEKRAELLSRARLLTLIDKLLNKKLILLSASAGYGKTSALIDFAHHSEMPVAWLSLDTLDTDPQRFIGYFIAALKQPFPKVGGQAKSLLSEITSFSPKEMERLVVTLVNDLYEKTSEHFVIILDDYHLVDYVEEIQHFINRFIQLADENCHLIISSRALIPLPDLPLMVARQQVDGLSTLELAFRADEIQALFQKNYQTNLPPKAAIALEKESEGWITCLQLSNIAARQGIPDIPRIARSSGVGLFEYFGHQILNQQSKELRDFLLRSSLLGEFNLALCEKVLSRFSPDPQNWSALIDTIFQKNLFALPVGVDREWIRYHHLFRDFLQRVLNRENPQLMDDILYRLAEVHTEQGEWEKAYHAYLELEDFEALSALVEKAGTHLQQHGRLLTLQNWLDNIPEYMRKNRPELLSLEGITTCSMGNVPKGLSLLNRAEEAFRQAGHAGGLARTLVRRTTAYQYQGDYAASLADAEEALKLTENKTSLVEINTDAKRSKGLSLFYLGKGEAAVKWLREALEGFSRLDRKQNMFVVLIELGGVYQTIGEFDAAKSSYEKAYEIGEKDGHLTWTVNLLNNLGVLYHQQAKYEKAIQTFEKGLSIAQKSGRLREQVALLIGLGDLYADLEEFLSARESFRQAEKIIQPENDRYLYRYLKLSEARVARSLQEYTQAHRLLKAIQLEDDDSGYAQGLFYLERGRLAVVEKDIPKALVNLREAKQYFRRDGRTLEYSWSQLWLSSAAYHSGDIETARKEIHEIILLTKDEKNITQMMVPQVRQVKETLLDMQKDRVVGNAIENFLDDISLYEVQLPATRRKLRGFAQIVALSEPHLSIHGLGRAQVKVNGRTLSLSDWKTQSVRDLFFFFLTTSHPVSKEEVGLAF